MPTIKRIGPYRFFFASSDGAEPAHVHVERDERVAKFWLETVELAKPVRFSSRELREIARLVSEHQDEFREAWNEFFRR